jgi:hypothetical protein
MTEQSNPKRASQAAIAKMLQTSHAQSVALHPHFYSGLYHRASEIKALDKIASQLRTAVADSRCNNYSSLPSVLHNLKEALAGKPILSWWSLFTVAVGHALVARNSESNILQANIEEARYLTEIASLLTELIRHYHAPDSKLLLEIRLIALEVDSRLIELSKIPTAVEESDETLDYIATEFALLNQELRRISTASTEPWKGNMVLLLGYFGKVNQLMRILQKIKISNSKSFAKFCQLPYLEELYGHLSKVVATAELINDAHPDSWWMEAHLETLFKLCDTFSDLLLCICPTALYPLLKRYDKLFTADDSLDKVRPSIFSSHELKLYIAQMNSDFAQQYQRLKLRTKEKGHFPLNKQLIQELFIRFREENDLHHIANFQLSKIIDPQQDLTFKSPKAIQQEILTRMIGLANSSQPRDLDTVLKNFSDEEREERYFIAQEVILEQFIRWRKLGIY